MSLVFLLLPLLFIGMLLHNVLVLSDLVDDIGTRNQKRRKLNALNSPPAVDKHTGKFEPSGLIGVAEDIRTLGQRLLKRDPTVTDAYGTSLKPLILEHFPAIISTYRQASTTANETQRSEIDLDFARACEMIRRTVQAAIDTNTDRVHGKLKTQLRFLELRHPDLVDLDEGLTPQTVTQASTSLRS